MEIIISILMLVNTSISYSFPSKNILLFYVFDMLLKSEFTVHKHQCCTQNYVFILKIRLLYCVDEARKLPEFSFSNWIWRLSHSKKLNDHFFYTFLQPNDSNDRLTTIKQPPSCLVYSTHTIHIGEVTHLPLSFKD